ncbi:hypothetical protein RhiirA5_427792 [Rhizophagus irregularis]|uniref:Uncharacterized protein n=2 Tax=Rhizophagus irregularis TaxID=588596 RepID=A0A2I1EH68_9GLOM|nr:hypothetical protein RirG_203480 [Rhizophagus irregularis DAOM 197198w]PKC00717.1 hypothetical protein RhiirA5_427792 [Rhizophagus irregularis]PKC63736.1 hypothetical protein RhiirA1_463373 [Rhizophagus irregularis]PKY21478.1 hypothetical protein RhiirB3_435085 [Rhizophagus irregularis]UZO18248.1 hypothetical protein OCT59_009567 [Rhizophagus irregularis]
MKIAKLDLFCDKDIDKIIAINKSSIISSYIFLVVISSSFSIKTTISDKATSDNKAVSGKVASGKVVSSSSKSSSSSVKTVISKESPLDNNVTITIFKVTKTKVTDQN